MIMSTVFRNTLYACRIGMIPCGALHYKNNEKSIIPNPQIEEGDKQDCVIEDGVFHDNFGIS
jgi:hypothetical protein